MTILVALHDGDTWIGSDSLVTDGEMRLPTRARKWSLGPHAAIGSTGDARTGDLIPHRLAAIDDDVDPRHYVDMLRTIAREDDFTPNPNHFGVKSYRNHFIIATRHGVFDVDCGFALDPISHGELWARGSGRDYALGCAFTTTGKPGKDRIRWALEAACKYDTNCGGELFVMNLTTGTLHA